VGRGGDVPVERARRIALGAQGFNDPRPRGRVDRRHLRRVLDRMGLIQIDSVNVLCRSQELPLFARLGPHPRTLIAEATAAGELFEYWVHEASHVPVELQPYLRWVMEDSHHWKALERFRSEHPGFVEDIYRRVRDEGPFTAGDLTTRVGKKGSWWDWDEAKYALEILFFEGRVSATRRPNDFARMYDLAERILPQEILDLPTPTKAEAQKELLRRAARHHGIGTVNDLADYHRQKVTPCKTLVKELVEEGELIETTVDGWGKPAYLHAEAKVPRKLSARALLSPFDPVVWYRERGRMLFDFEYKIEIYTPAPQRRYGYYVLPFLLGDTIVGRVDLKADRVNGRLLVPGAHAEPGVDHGRVATELVAELVTMADWLGLPEGIEVAPNGDLAPALSATIP